MHAMPYLFGVIGTIALISASDFADPILTGLFFILLAATLHAVMYWEMRKKWRSVSSNGEHRSQ
jgi:hypothetical protein